MSANAKKAFTAWKKAKKQYITACNKLDKYSDEYGNAIDWDGHTEELDDIEDEISEGFDEED